ncbi:hypothetical protein ACEQUB_01649 [Ralstonia syzygii]
MNPKVNDVGGVNGHTFDVVTVNASTGAEGDLLAAYSLCTRPTTTVYRV